MTSTLPGEQVEHAFNPKRLCNWETPAQPNMGQTFGNSRFGTLKPRSNTTKPIVDEKGYLLPTVPKIKNAFQPCASPSSIPRWPTPNTSYTQAPCATMGYKGIQTDYLPTTTVSSKTADINGTREFNYNFR
uniref:Cilia- and flagella-associated protein 126 n=1 Tax=Dunaliella tertiolecta TaxID=3047 RepID=A0A6S8I3J0_DUNTE|mmetsp:Transcript_3757/g.10216  ORF Transcript_3757/g.10216 Transcript_3757/m.10216 type:complete len:131 (-) Transcript_3757:504-896(-)